MPVACWPAEATICAAAWAASPRVSARMLMVWLDWPPARIASETPLVTSSVERTAVWVARWISPRIWRTWVLGGDHGEPLALLAGARRLDRRVQRQDVGLLGDVVDGGDDLADGLRLLGQAEDVGGGRLDARLQLVERGDRRLDRLPPVLADVEGALDRLADPLGALRGLVGGLGDLIDGGDGLGDGGGLLLGAGGLLRRAGEDLGGGRRQLGDDLADRLQQALVLLVPQFLAVDQVAEVPGHRVDGDAEHRQLVVPLRVHVRGKVAAGHPIGRAEHFAGAAVDPADDPELRHQDQHDAGGVAEDEPFEPTQVLLGDLPGELDRGLDLEDLGVDLLLESGEV
jgi:hypothetical protein